MKHFKKPDGSQDHLITEDMAPCEAPVPAPVVLTKAERVAALFAPYGITRIQAQMAIGIGELDARLKAATEPEVTYEAALADTMTRNSTYRICRLLENAARAIETGP